MPNKKLHAIAKKYFEFSAEQQKKVQIELCRETYALWLSHVKENGITNYRESVAGTLQEIDYSLPKDAIEAVAKENDDLNINKRYLEPIAALQDSDLMFNENIEMAYYSIYSLYQFHIQSLLEDSWLIVNQALSAFGEENSIKKFELAVNNAA